MAASETQPEPPLVVIVGPTASGKTALAIKLARLPAMPPEVKSSLIGESLEMYFDFNF